MQAPKTGEIMSPNESSLVFFSSYMQQSFFFFFLWFCCVVFPDRVLKCQQGVTYCGESSASSLTMANVPWHQEVVAFVQQLADMLPRYEIACEHEHSNCLLLAHTKVRKREAV